MSKPLMQGPLTKWTVSEDRSELVGPCGCRVKNDLDGLMNLHKHKCDG